MTDIDTLVSELSAGRKRFLALVTDIRPDLHRYCARITGSVSEGEDIVQETLARAYYALPEIETLPPLRSWLFTIAHRRALDHLRRYDRRMGRSLDDIADAAADPADGPEERIARDEATRAALSTFLDLPPLPRSCVILKDVLGHSLEEIAVLLEQSLPAVKAALHRGRVRLRALGDGAERPSSGVASGSAGVESVSPSIVRYAALFNARDWEGVRALLADEVRLDLVSRSQRAGKREVAGYVANYAKYDDWYLAPARLDGADIVAAFRSPNDRKPSYFIELSWANGLVTRIRDFRYVSYICADAVIEVVR
jgi:RNA polymerase sigma-70 factor (ECF subfamily)